MECLVIARHLHTLTDKAFDVSIGSGLERLELAVDELHVHALADGVRLDLGGIGKGYAVDRLATVLEEWGLDGRWSTGAGARSWPWSRPRTTTAGRSPCARPGPE